MGKRRGFKGPFNQDDLPNRIDPIELDTLVSKLRNGDDTVRATIIGGHMRMGMAIVANYAYKYPHLVDDLVGAAMMGICQAVDWAADRMYDNNITPYIHQTCERHVKELIENRMVVTIPRKTFTSLKEEEEFVPVMNTIHVREDEDNPTSMYDHMTELEAKTVEENPILFEELLESLALPTRDKIVIDMLMADYTLTEITNVVGTTVANLSLVKYKVGHQLIRRNNASGRTKCKINQRNTQCAATH